MSVSTRTLSISRRIITSSSPTISSLTTISFPPKASIPQKGLTRTYLTTPPTKSASLIAGLAGVALVTQVVRQGTLAYEEFSKQKPEEEVTEDGKSKKKKKRENFFDQFGFSGPSKYYEGGFELEMTRREAALILGVRESASSKRIKDAHRNILIANHPDTGGSTFLASKVNEAKELLLKGKDK